MNKELILLISLCIGILGTIIPLLPGLPLMFIALLVYGISDNWQHYSVFSLSIIGVITIFSVFMDYFAAIWGSKKLGATSQGVWLGVLGGILGLFFGGPGGFILGVITGSFCGELLNGKSIKEAIIVAAGNILGTIGSSLLQFFFGLIILLWALFLLY